jgi:hypothetical protein
MHPALRSIAKVAGVDPAKRTVGSLEQVSRRHNWVQRAQAYDAHADELRQARCEEIRAAHDKVTLDSISKIWAKSQEAIDNWDAAKITPQYMANLMNALVKNSRITTGASVPAGDGPDKPFEQVIAELNKEVAKK